MLVIGYLPGYLIGSGPADQTVGVLAAYHECLDSESPILDAPIELPSRGSDFVFSGPSSGSPSSTLQLTPKNGPSILADTINPKAELRGPANTPLTNISVSRALFSDYHPFSSEKIHKGNVRFSPGPVDQSPHFSFSGISEPNIRQLPRIIVTYTLPILKLSRETSPIPHSKSNIGLLPAFSIAEENRPPAFSALPKSIIPPHLRRASNTFEIDDTLPATSVPPHSRSRDMVQPLMVAPNKQEAVVEAKNVELPKSDKLKLNQTLQSSLKMPAAQSREAPDKNSATVINSGQSLDVTGKSILLHLEAIETTGYLSAENIALLHKVRDGVSAQNVSEPADVNFIPPAVAYKHLACLCVMHLIVLYSSFGTDAEL